MQSGTQTGTIQTMQPVVTRQSTTLKAGRGSAGMNRNTNRIACIVNMCHSVKMLSLRKLQSLL